MIRVRRDFLAANTGLRVATPGFVLLVRQNSVEPGEVRMGFTVTKKIGNSVTRNRLKRRLRALVRERLPYKGIDGADHVLIGRDDGLTRDFADMRRDLDFALDRVRDGKAKLARPGQRKGRGNKGQGKRRHGDTPNPAGAAF